MTQKKAPAKKKAAAKKTAAAKKNATAKKTAPTKKAATGKSQHAVTVVNNVVKIDDIAEIQVSPQFVAEIEKQKKNLIKKFFSFLKS